MRLAVLIGPDHLRARGDDQALGLEGEVLDRDLHALAVQLDRWPSVGGGRGVGGGHRHPHRGSRRREGRGRRPMAARAPGARSRRARRVPAGDHKTRGTASVNDVSLLLLSGELSRSELLRAIVAGLLCSVVATEPAVGSENRRRWGRPLSSRAATPRGRRASAVENPAAARAGRWAGSATARSGCAAAARRCRRRARSRRSGPGRAVRPARRRRRRR